MALLGAEVIDITPVPDAPDWARLHWLDVNVWFAGGRTERFRLLITVCHVDRMSTRRADLTGVPDGIIGSIVLDGAEHVVAEALSRDETAALSVKALFPDLAFTTARPDLRGGPAMAVMVDTGYVVKLYRRIDREVNPDLEVVSALANIGFRDAHDPVAVIEYDGFTLAYVRASPDTRQDGVGVYVTALTEMFKRRCAPPDLRTDAVRPMRAIGAAIARLHLALADVFGALPGQGEPWATAMLGHLERKAGDRIDLQQLRDVLGRLHLATDLGRSIRIHHHLHLGNAVSDGTNWRIVNFEGDGRPFSEVRTMSSPLQDLSRVISSIELTGSSVLAQFAEDDVERDRELGVLLEALEQRVIDALIDGYGQPEGIERLLPDSSDSRDALLAIFEMHHRIEAAIPDPEDAPWARTMSTFDED